MIKLGSKVRWRITHLRSVFDIDMNYTCLIWACAFLSEILAHTVCVSRFPWHHSHVEYVIILEMITNTALYNANLNAEFI